jgi:hypothetical protein
MIFTYKTVYLRYNKVEGVFRACELLQLCKTMTRTPQVCDCVPTANKTPFFHLCPPAEPVAEPVTVRPHVRQRRMPRVKPGQQANTRRPYQTPQKLAWRTSMETRAALFVVKWNCIAIRCLREMLVKYSVCMWTPPPWTTVRTPVQTPVACEDY